MLLAHTTAHGICNMWQMQFAFASQLHFALSDVCFVLFVRLWLLLLLVPCCCCHLLFISLHTQLRLMRIRFSLTHFRCCQLKLPVAATATVTVNVNVAAALSIAFRLDLCLAVEPPTQLTHPKTTHREKSMVVAKIL